MDLIANVVVWFKNAKSTHCRVMSNYLRKRGWVVFYLEEEVRSCKGDVCWLELYNSEQARNGK